MLAVKKARMRAKVMVAAQWFVNEMAFGNWLASSHGALDVVKLTFQVFMLKLHTTWNGYIKLHKRDSNK